MVAVGFVAGFGLGTWYGSRRVVHKIQAHVGREKWDRVKGRMKP